MVALLMSEEEDCLPRQSRVDNIFTDMYSLIGYGTLVYSLHGKGTQDKAMVHLCTLQLLGIWAPLSTLNRQLAENRFIVSRSSSVVMYYYIITPKLTTTYCQIY